MKTTADKQTLTAMSQKYIEDCRQTQTVEMVVGEAVESENCSCYKQSNEK